MRGFFPEFGMLCATIGESEAILGKESNKWAIKLNICTSSQYMNENLSEYKNGHKDLKM